jgi:hypothetical protein
VFLTKTLAPGSGSPVFTSVTFPTMVPTTWAKPLAGYNPQTLATKARNNQKRFCEKESIFYLLLLVLPDDHPCIGCRIFSGTHSAIAVSGQQPLRLRMNIHGRRRVFSFGLIDSCFSRRAKARMAGEKKPRWKHHVIFTKARKSLSPKSAENTESRRVMIVSG